MSCSTLAHDERLEIIFQEAVTCKLPLRGPSRCFIGSQSAHYRKSSRGGYNLMLHSSSYTHTHRHTYTCRVMQSHIAHVPRHTLFTVTGDVPWCRETFQVHRLRTNDIRSQKSSREQSRLQMSGNNKTRCLTSQHRMRLEPIKVCGHHFPEPWLDPDSVLVETGGVCDMIECV